MEVAEFIPRIVDKGRGIAVREIQFQILALILTRLLSIGLKRKEGFPGGAVVESLPANAGDTGSSPGLGGSHMPRSN